MRKLLFIGITLLSISGCSYLYKQPIFQGTLLDKKNVDQLKVGLSQQEVFQLVGTPPIADPFHQNRWDYTATARRGNDVMHVKTLTIFFADGKLVKWEGEYFTEEDYQLAKEMGKFGNLPKDKKKNQ